jgi:hypothetical protein
MVSNQVVFSSIWYMASCSDISGKALKLARVAVRNYMWLGKNGTSARARIKWDTSGSTHCQWRYKNSRPSMAGLSTAGQTTNQRSVHRIRAWKTLVRFRVAQTKQSQNGRWQSHANWIMNSRNLVK